MTHLIDKSALVAEIERIRRIEVTNNDVAYNGALDEIRYFLDTLEVKEVDLEKEVDNWRHNHFHSRRDKEASGEYLKRSSQLDLAKYFFELGLKIAQKGKEVDLEKDVRQILSLYYEGIKHYDDIIKEEREENGGSNLAIKIMDGVVDARELGIQYVIDKLKAQKGEQYDRQSTENP